MEEHTLFGRLSAQRDALLDDAAALAGEIAELETALNGFLSRRERASAAAQPPLVSDAPRAADDAAQCARLARDVCRLRSIDGYARYLAADFEEKLLSLSDSVECALRGRE